MNHSPVPWVEKLLAYEPETDSGIHGRILQIYLYIVILIAATGLIGWWTSIPGCGPGAPGIYIGIGGILPLRDRFSPASRQRNG